MVQTNRIALLQKAEDAARRGEYNEALGIVSRCLDLYPGFSPARVLKSEILSRTGDIEAAVRELREIIASNPENIRARMILTELLIQENDQKQAMSHLEFLSFMVPENDPALLDLRQRAEELQPVARVEEEAPQPLEFGIIEEANEDDAAELSTDDLGADEGDNLILEDDVTEIFTEEELGVESMEAPDSIGERRDSLGHDNPEISSGRIEMADMEEHLEEVPENVDVQQSEVVTVHVPDGEEGSVESEKQDVEIKTLTMARVYERQKMYREALEILETLYSNEQSEELSEEIQRVKRLVDDKAITGQKGQRERVIVSLRDWMEKITCNSMK